MHRLSVFLMFALTACVGARYPQGHKAFEAAQGPVVVVHQPSPSDLTHFEILVRAGSAHDPVGQEGLAHLTARLLREGGAGTRSPAAVEAVLYRMGTNIEVVVDREMVSFRVTSVVEDGPELAALLGDMLMSPRLDPATLERVRGHAGTYLSRGIVQNDETLGDSVLQARLYAGHGYGHPVQGRTGVLDTLDEDAVRTFLQDRYVRPAIVLGVAGAASDEVILGLRDRLSQAPARLYQDVSPRAVPKPRGRTVLVVEKETGSTGIHFGHPTVLRRDHADWPAMMLATAALGEHRQSHGRLYKSLRETRGLNYGDYAYVEYYRQQGWSHRQQTGTGRMDNPFYVWLRPVEPENAVFALKGAVRTVESWVEHGLDEEEFARMKQYLQSRIALWAADPARRLGWATEAALMGWPNPILDLPAAISTLNRAEVNAAIQRHVDPSQLEIVVVTADGDAFAEAVRTESPTPIVYEASPPDAESDQAKEDEQIAGTPLQIGRVEIIPATGLFR